MTAGRIFTAEDTSRVQKTFESVPFIVFLNKDGSFQEIQFVIAFRTSSLISILVLGMSLLRATLFALLVIYGAGSVPRAARRILSAPIHADNLFRSFYETISFPATVPSRTPAFEKS